MSVIFSTKNSKENNKNNQENKKVVFSTVKSPKALGYSRKAVVTGNLLFCGARIGLDPKSMALIEGGIKNETRQMCRNIASILEENKTSLKNVVKTTIYLKNLSDLDIVENIYKDYFILKPARTIVGVSELPRGASISIEVIAEIQ